MDKSRNITLIALLAGGVLLAPLMGRSARLWSQTQSPAGSGLHRTPTPILAVPVKSFKVEHASMAEALLKLRSSDVPHVVIGFERIPHRGPDKGGPISLAATDSTLGEVVQRLCRADPRYEYELISGLMIEVRPKGAAKDPKDLLNMIIQDYRIDADIAAWQAVERIKDDAPELRAFLRSKAEEWAKRTGRATGSPGSLISGNMSPPRFTLELHHVTMRQILNAISLKSIEMFKEGKNYAPTGWEYDFVIVPNAPTGIDGFPKWTSF